jgi:hypothetical protein
MNPEKPKYCDMVMKGGITSGVVYPTAICELATQYQFRNIGGASAGAIAAARLPRRIWQAERRCRQLHQLGKLPEEFGSPGFLPRYSRRMATHTRRTRHFWEFSPPSLERAGLSALSSAYSVSIGKALSLARLSLHSSWRV